MNTSVILKWPGPFRSLLIAFLFLTVPFTQGAEIELLTRPHGQGSRTTGNGDSLAALYSPDGQFILFSSSANDLVSDPGNTFFDLFLRNGADGSARLISSGTNNTPANGVSVAGGMSKDNRYVVFQSAANNLSEGDTNNTMDVYLRDLQTGVVTLVSRGPDGLAGNRDSIAPQISENGQWVVFESLASNFALSDSNNVSDIYAWNRIDGSMQLVSGDANGMILPPNMSVGEFDISGDGSVVVFSAAGVHLMTRQSGTNEHIYARNLATGALTWVSSVFTNMAGFENAAASAPRISKDGRFVYFVAVMRYLGELSLMRVDLNDFSTKIVPFERRTSQFEVSISEDGRFAAYFGGTNIYRFDATSETSEQVDVGGGPGSSQGIQISHDGRSVAFYSDKTNLVAGNETQQMQLYVRDMETGTTRLVTRRLDGTPVDEFNLPGMVAQFSPADSALLFESADSGLVASDTINTFDVFSWTAGSQQIELLSSPTNSSRAEIFAAPSTYKGVSRDGRFTSFQTLGRMHPNDTNTANDAYIYDRVLRTNILVSAGVDGFAFGSVTSTRVADNGSVASFECSVTGVTGPTDTRRNIYIRDSATGVITPLVSPTILGAVGVASADHITGAGKFLFATVTGSAAGYYRYNLTDGTNVRYAVNPTANSFLSASADGGVVTLLRGTSTECYTMATSNRLVLTGVALVSADGSRLLQRFSTNLVAHDRATGTSNVFRIGATRSISSSADGRWVAYEMRQSIAGVTRGIIGVLDVTTGQTNLVSRQIGASEPSAGISSSPVISADGRFVALESWASDLVENDKNSNKDVFLYDRESNQLTLVSHTLGTSIPANAHSINPVFSADGSTLVFASNASDLVAEDNNDTINLFALSLAQPTLTLKIRLLTNGPELSWESTAGKRYQVEYKTALTDANWLPNGPEVTAVEGENSVPESSSDTQRFYRLRLLQ